MSTDYYLVSSSRKIKAMVGSAGISGVQVWSDNPALPFIRWAINEFVADVIFINEHRLEAIDPEDKFEDFVDDN